MVERMTEFMDQRFQLGVLEALAIEVGDEHTVRRPPFQQARRAHAEICGVTELAVARIEVEIHAADKVTGLRIVDVVIRDLRMPHGNGGCADRGSKLDAVQHARDVHHPCDRSIAREVFAQCFAVDVVARFAQLVAIVRAVPVVDFHLGDRLAGPFRLQSAQFRRILHRDLADD